MFSGIVQCLVKVVQKITREGGVTFVLDLGSLAKDVKIGASVAVSGVCLTVVKIDGNLLSFDLMQETLDKTTLGDLKEGDGANVERSVKFGDEIGGHRVSGHVTGVATIVNIETPPNNMIVTLQGNAAWMDAIMPKGFIAIDGCSLTVVDVKDDTFTVHLIPETLRVTTFGAKGVGDRVNIELDPETVTIVETVKRILQSQKNV